MSSIEALAVKPPTSYRARQLYLHVHCMGTRHMAERTSFLPYEKPGIGLFWVVSGAGRVVIDGRPRSIVTGDSAWLFGPDVSRTFEPGNDGLTTRHLWFAGPGVDQWLGQMVAASSSLLVVDQAVKIRDLYDRLLANCTDQHDDWEWDNHLSLTLVLREAMLAIQPNHERASIAPDLAIVLDAIAANPDRDWAPKELAAMAGMSYSAFRQSFRCATGEAPHEYIQRTRILRARELLGRRGMRVSEVARQLEFNSPAYFSAFFRRMTGISPREFRDATHKRNPPRVSLGSL